MQWHDDRATRVLYSTDNSIYQVEPEAVGLPSSAAELAGALSANYSSAEPKPLVARGGGTGTNGQSLTNSLSVDLKRNLNAVVSLDIGGRRVVVQPGIVTAQMNEQLAAHDLFWPPHTSTLNRATVGGMISTDAAGKGSLVYGRAHRHVERLVVLLDDGTEFIAEPTSRADAAELAAGGGRRAEVWRSLLELEQELAGVDLGLPELARGFSGYGLDRFVHDDMIDPVSLFCGAEGTLGIVVEATLRLSPIPEQPRLVVASYETFNDALEDALSLRETGPSAIEAFDETTLARGRSSPAWPALGAAIGDHEGAVLLIEYTDEAAKDAEAILSTIEQTGRSHARRVVDVPADQAQIWKVRADAVGLLAKVAVGGPQLSARPTAFVEDCAVPVASMPGFIAGFRSVLDEAGLEYAMFGHADVGCVHVRPALDLTTVAQRALVSEVTSKVTALVAEHGGLVWGEHGRGFRGAHVDAVLPPATVGLMRSVKSAFDPRDLFNPGKLYRPLESPERVLDVGDPAMRGQFDAAVPVEIRREYDSAFACNGNGLCHHYSPNEVMCPSYKATGDPAFSPRGRVDLLRSWLSDSDPDPTFNDELAANLHQCLSCSACTGRCPVEVNVPELKSQFLDEYHRNVRRPPSHYLLSWFEELASLAARFPRLSALGAKPAARALGLVDLPTPTSARGQHKAFTGQSGLDAVVLPDVFTDSLEPATLAAAVSALESVGYAAAVHPFVASGKFDHVKGRRARFKKAVTRQAGAVRSIAASGAKAVVIEPAVALLHDHEYPAMQSGYPSDEVVPLAQLLLDRADQLPKRGAGQSVRLLGHCTERATEPERAALWEQLLRAAGYQVDAPTAGCCGMAGIFGHEVNNQAMSRRLWELSWEPLVSDAPDQVVATGYSCRSQAKRFGAELVHPLHLLI